MFLDEVDEIWHRPGQAVVEEVEVEVALALGVAVKLVLKTLDEKVGLTLDVGRGQFRLVEAVPNEELLHRLVVEGQEVPGLGVAAVPAVQPRDDVASPSPGVAGHLVAHGEGRCCVKLDRVSLSDLDQLVEVDDPLTVGGYPHSRVSLPPC